MKLLKFTAKMVKKIIMCDEAHFHLEGYVNRQNWDFAHFFCDEKMKFGGHFCIQNVFLNFLVNNNLLMSV